MATKPESFTPQISCGGVDSACRRNFQNSFDDDVNSSNNNTNTKVEYGRRSIPNPPRSKRPKTGRSGETEQEVDSILSNALMDLKLKDRAIVEQDIHGVADQMRKKMESPEQIRQMLTSFETALLLLYSERRHNHHVHTRNHHHGNDDGDDDEVRAYHLAVTQKYHYVTSATNERLRMKFIRIEQYDIDKAVQRFLGNLNFLLQLYGPDALQRPLQMEDLNYNSETHMKAVTSSAMKFFKMGYYQVLPGRDRAGRRVMFTYAGNHGHDLIDVIKASFFQATVISDEEAMNHRGFVFLLYVDRLSSELLQMSKSKSDSEPVRKIIECYPIKPSAMHICIPNTNDIVFRAVKVGLDVVTKHYHTVTRIHQSNSIVELQHRLMTFGLPTEDANFPVTTGSILKRKNHLDWIQSHHNMDALSRQNQGRLPPTIISCPDPKDILFSMKHKRDRRQEGNQELERLIDTNIVAFHDAPARSKQRDTIVRNVIQHMRVSWPGRFLVWNDKMLWWDEVESSSSSSSSSSSTLHISDDKEYIPNIDLETKIRKKFNSKHRQDMK